MTQVIRRLTIIGLIAWLLGSNVLAADRAKETSASAHPTRYPKCCVWRATNAKAPFYLLGSIHSLEKRDYPLPSPYELAINESHRFVFEYDPEKNDEFQKKLAEAAKYPAGQDIRNKIHSKTLSWLRSNTQFV